MGASTAFPSAPVNSPAFTGNPTAPTQSAGNNSTRLATTAYVDTAAALKSNLATPSFTTTIGVGAATAAATGAGVSFPATQSASSDANTLDDYEEGTWTPTLNGATTTTYTTQTGLYTKVGRLVHVFCSLVINSVGNGSTSIVAGLPFSSSNVGPALAVATSTGLAVTPVAFAMYATTTQAVATGRTAASANVTDGLAVFGNSARVDFAGCYNV